MCNSPAARRIPEKVVDHGRTISAASAILDGRSFMVSPGTGLTEAVDARCGRNCFQCPKGLAISVAGRRQ